jgi:hypothetical protein
MQSQFMRILGAVLMTIRISACEWAWQLAGKAVRGAREGGSFNGSVVDIDDY